MNVARSGAAPVLLVERDETRQTAFAAALTDAGFTVTAVDRIAAIERWPEGHIVVVHPRDLTPWWTQVGAAGVIALADAPDATAAAGALVNRVREMGRRSFFEDTPMPTGIS